MKFVHAADLHVDSPLRGLERYEGAPAERVRGATRQALEKLVDVCLEEEAAFLVVAGDLFDGDWSDFNSPMFAVGQMRRLRERGIPVYVIRGNHDSRDEMTYRVPWPDNLQILDCKKPQTVVRDDLGVAVHGMSFPRREVRENLVPDYPAPIGGLLNVGLLHTNATGSPDHDSYAPCSVDELVAKGYSYWALGHIHKREILHKEPFVVYPGNTQGRHARETGEKGCAVVEVSGGEAASVRFRPTDVLRWRREPIDLEPEDGADELVDKARLRIREIADEQDGRFAAVRLEVRGRCRAHRELIDEVRRQNVVNELRAAPGDLGADVWIEKVKLDTDPPLDLARLREGKDVLGGLLRSVEAVANDPKALMELSGLLAKLKTKTALQLKDEPDGGPGFDSPDQLKRWLRRAEDELLNRLTERPRP